MELIGKGMNSKKHFKKEIKINGLLKEWTMDKIEKLIKKLIFDGVLYE